MNKLFVLDASALLAFLSEEPGYSIVEKHIDAVYISTVNLSEVMACLIKKGANEMIIFKSAEFVKEVIPFDFKQAQQAASFIKHTQKYGLSFGDRACLALAKSYNASVLTADKIWSKLKLGIDITVIR